MKEEQQKQFTGFMVKAMKILPLIFVLALIAVAFIIYQHVQIDKLDEFIHKNLLMGILVVMGLYAVKSMTVVLPVPVLYIAVGTLFPNVAIAAAVNTLGLIAELTVPYALGRLAGQDLHRYILEKYPKARGFADYKDRHNFFMIYMMRLIGIFSADLTSMMMGSSKLPFKSYLLGSLLGMMPSMLIITFLGANVTNPRSAEFMLSVVLTVLLTCFSFILYRRYNKQNEKKRAQAAEAEVMAEEGTTEE